MKKFLVAFVAVMVVVGCSTVAPAPSFVGTWVNKANDIEWTFTADGKWKTSRELEGTYTFINPKLIIIPEDERAAVLSVTRFSNGKALLLEATSVTYETSRSLDGNYWLEKK